jgi:hypothetical protein
MRLVLLLLCAVLPLTAWAECSPKDISVRITKARWVDECKTRSCVYLKGAAVMHQGCRQPVAVKVRIVGHAEDGTPVAADELWPFSTRNVEPGVHPFGIDQWLDYDEEIRTFSLEAVEVTVYE